MSEPAQDATNEFEAGLDRLACAGLSGDGVVIAHLDTGVSSRTPHLAGRIATQVEISRDGTGEHVAARVGGEHGTYTAGLIVGRRTGQLREGAAPGATLCAVTVIEAGDTVARIVAGLNWAIGAGARVVCLSAGVAPPSPVLEVAASHLASRGILVVCPSGNGGAGRYVMPGGAAADVLSVGASDGRRVAPFSGSRNTDDGSCVAPLVAAPGVGHLGVTLAGTAAPASGTSASTALVAGLAALMLEAVPESSPLDVIGAIAESALPVPVGQEHRCVAGLVDPIAAVNLLRAGVMPRHVRPGAQGPEHRARIDPRLNLLAERGGRSSPLPAVAVGCDRAAVADAVAGCGRIERCVTLEHLPAAILSAPLDALGELSGDPRICAVGSAHVDRTRR